MRWASSQSNWDSFYFISTNARSFYHHANLIAHHSLSFTSRSNSCPTPPQRSRHTTTITTTPTPHICAELFDVKSASLFIHIHTHLSSLRQDEVLIIVVVPILGGSGFSDVVTVAIASSRCSDKISIVL